MQERKEDNAERREWGETSAGRKEGEDNCRENVEKRDWLTEKTPLQDEVRYNQLYKQENPTYNDKNQSVWINK